MPQRRGVLVESEHWRPALSQPFASGNAGIPIWFRCYALGPACLRVALAFMSAHPQSESIGSHSFANKAFLTATLIACVSIFAPAIIWRMGRWALILTTSGVFCFASLVALLFGAAVIRRGLRGFRAFAAVVISTLAVLFWCFMMLVFIQLRNGGNE